jgi:hypothetical protein
VDDNARSLSHTNTHACGVDDPPRPVPNPVPGPGHFKRALLGHSCQAPKESFALFALLHAPLPGLFRAQGASLHRVGLSGFLILSGPIVNTFDLFLTLAPDLVQGCDLAMRRPHKTVVHTVSIMWARSVIRSNSALHNRGFGNTVVHSENGKFVVTMIAARSGRDWVYARRWSSDNYSRKPNRADRR